MFNKDKTQLLDSFHATTARRGSMNTTKKGFSNIKKFNYIPAANDKSYNDWASRGSIGPTTTSKIIIAQDENDPVL